MIELTPIGRMRTPFETTHEAPNQGYKANAEGVIEVAPEYADGLADFEVGETIVIVWWAQDADAGVLSVERAHGKGVFKTRSPARPNRLCLTPCEIVGIHGSEIEVVGVDMTDGTSVVDLKPPLDRLGDWDEYRDLRAAYERSQ